MPSLYSRYLFPPLCDLVMNCALVRKLRREVLQQTQGDILEIGVGTGLNLPHYPPRVRRLVTVDPNPGMNRLLRRRIAQSGIAVEHHVLPGERLPFAVERFDCVVSTWTMCSIVHLTAALAEVQRVLRPGGRFIFIEHGLSDDPRIQRWQRRLNWLEGKLADGCRLDIDFRALFERQPFTDVQMDSFVVPHTPRTHGTLYRGTARK